MGVPSDPLRSLSEGWLRVVRRSTLVSMITTEPPPGTPIGGGLPKIAAPPAFRERRGTFRRGEDQAVHEDRALLARSLDILAGPGDAVEQLAASL